jgi:hypothetical protein
MEKLTKDLIEIITAFNKSLTNHLPALEAQIKEIIDKKIINESQIEHLLDTLLSMSTHGIGNDLFIQLIEYYKIASPEGAEFYWNEYDNNDQD